MDLVPTFIQATQLIPFAQPTIVPIYLDSGFDWGALAAWFQAIFSVVAILAAWKIPLAHSERVERQRVDSNERLIIVLSGRLVKKLDMLHNCLANLEGSGGVEGYCSTNRDREWPALVMALQSISVTDFPDECENLMLLLIAAQQGQAIAEDVAKTYRNIGFNNFTNFQPYVAVIDAQRFLSNLIYQAFQVSRSKRKAK